MYRIIRTIQIGLVAVLATACAGRVPQKVNDSLTGRFPGAKVTSMEKEREDGKVVYDFELTQDGRKYETDIASDGTILEIEKEIKVTDLPAAVAKAVAEAYPMSNIASAMEVDMVSGKDEKAHHYEVMVMTAARRSIEVNVDMDGKNLKESEDNPKPRKSYLSLE